MGDLHWLHWKMNENNSLAYLFEDSFERTHFSYSNLEIDCMIQ